MGRKVSSLRLNAKAVELPKGETDMVYLLRRAVLDFWDGWTGIFEPLPYGDPYISVFALVMVFLFGVKLLSRWKIA